MAGQTHALGKACEPLLLQVMSYHNEYKPGLRCWKPRLGVSDPSESPCFWKEQFRAEELGKTAFPSLNASVGPC